MTITEGQSVTIMMGIMAKGQTGMALQKWLRTYT